MTRPAYLFLIGLLLSAPVFAQSRVSLGPQVGVISSTASFKKWDVPFNTTYRAGFEAGVQANVAWKRIALQPALLYSQLGFGIYNTRSFPAQGNPYLYQVDEQYRFNYLTFTPQLAFCLGRDGQGLQVFGGPYLAWLLGGTYSAHDTNEWAGGAGFVRVDDGRIEAGDQKSVTSYNSTTYYMPGHDLGVRAGLGYHLGPVLVQGSFSLGLKNLGSDYGGAFGARTDYYNRAFRLTASYQFTADSK